MKYLAIDYGTKRVGIAVSDRDGHFVFPRCTLKRETKAAFWEEFLALLEKEQPDIMYIHNPYDQYNTVTMVEPRFFSDELKAHGGILVYVPYYISGGCERYENLDIAYGKGAVNSDYIILQSEAQKEAYKYWGFPERRLLVLGSPKIDAIVKLSEKQLELNTEWENVIQGKKVILLNTSINLKQFYTKRSI